VEISVIKLDPDGTEETLTELVNPGMPIPKGSSDIHGITDDKVAGKPTFKELAAKIKTFIGNADLSGFNCLKFDVPLLVEEFLRNDEDFEMKGRKVVDVQNIFHKLEQRTLVAAYKFYCNGDLTNAHSAEADTRATMEVLLAQVEKYDELEGEVQMLHEFSRRGKAVDFAGHIVENEKGEAVFNFGKNKGKSVVEVLKTNPGYYSWMMDAQFPSYTKKVLTEIRVDAFNKGLL
ncbi:MAG TPA: DNA polymerase III subunit epsilon, partial [Flavobacteriales bacterium]|nr:DNA polymerase III subunit epsilon [Flavobacteriales bacterium]